MLQPQSKRAGPGEMFSAPRQFVNVSKSAPLGHRRLTYCSGRQVVGNALDAQDPLRVPRISRTLEDPALSTGPFPGSGAPEP